MTISALDLATETKKLLTELGVRADRYTGGTLRVTSPVTGKEIGALKEHSASEAKDAIEAAHKAFLEWRAVPAPKRGELVRLLGEELRAAKAALGRLVSIEVGKIASEGLGEVQEMIDICDFAVGLSRQLDGRTMPSERPGHRLMETWHPLGVVGVISAFNFPAAVWSWNAALALVCGDTVVWKPSEKQPSSPSRRLHSPLVPPVMWCTGEPQRSRAHRRRRRATPSRQSARSADQCDRFRTDGGSHRTAGRRALWPQHFGARREQRGGGYAVSGPRFGGARHRLRRRRDRRATMHNHASSHRA